jgi:hypothetical protein
MKQEFVLFLLCMLLLLGFSQAQTPRFKLALEGENKDILPQKYLGQEGDFYWYLGNEVRAHYNIGGTISPVLFKLDKDLAVVEANPLEVKESDIQFLDQAVLQNGTVYVLVQKDSNMGLKTEIYFSRFDLDGKALESLPLMELKVKPIPFTPAPDRKYDTAVSPDGNWFYFCLTDKNDPAKESLSMDVLVIDLKQAAVQSHQVTLKEEKRYVEDLQLVGANDGTAIFLYESNYAGPIERKDPKVKKKKVSYALNTSKLLKIDFDGNKKELTLYSGKDYVRTALIKLGKDDFLYYADLLSIDEDQTAQHTYQVKKINPGTFEIINEVSGEFDQTHFSNLEGLDLKEGQYGLPMWAVINDIILAEDRTVKIIFRHSYQPRMQSTATTYTFHEAIFVLSLDVAGAIDWAVTLPHGQISDARLREEGILTRENNSSLLILFNSVPKILSKTYTEVPRVREAKSVKVNTTIAAYFIVDEEGNYQKKALFEELGGAADLSDIGKLSDDEFSFLVFTFKQAKPVGALIKARFN